MLYLKVLSEQGVLQKMKTASVMAHLWRPRCGCTQLIKMSCDNGNKLDYLANDMLSYEEKSKVQHGDWRDCRAQIIPALMSRRKYCIYCSCWPLLKHFVSGKQSLTQSIGTWNGVSHELHDDFDRQSEVDGWNCTRAADSVDVLLRAKSREDAHNLKPLQNSKTSMYIHAQQSTFKPNRSLPLMNFQSFLSPSQ